MKQENKAKETEATQGKYNICSLIYVCYHSTPAHAYW